MKGEFIRALIHDLRFPPELRKLFAGVNSADNLAQIKSNKDNFVKNKIGSCTLHVDKATPTALAKQGYITVKPGEIKTTKKFALQSSFQQWGTTIKAPVVFEKNVTIERSTIVGPTYISENSRISDSHIRGTSNGASYLGKNCNVWDFSEINRSFIGDSSKVHTCNINDSIIGPNSSFGATHMLQARDDNHQSENLSLHPTEKTLLERRIVVANYSLGNNVKILDPTSGAVLQINATHLGAICGTGVSCASGTTIYPGTIVGAGAKIITSIPITGYIKPDQVCSFYFIIKENKNGRKALQPKGTLTQLMKEHFTSTLQ